jgi:hypothetical protein
MFKQFFAACVIGLGGFGVAGNAAAATVRPLLLDEIVDSAAIAFHGTCIANRVERDTVTNFIVTYTTFEVRDVIKGGVAFTHVIKQIGGILPDGESGMVVDGVPKFAVGQDYVLFLAGVSSLGFSSPVALAQGSFSVRHDKAGGQIVMSRDVRELTAKMPRAVLPAKVVDADAEVPLRQLGLDDFKQMARTYAKQAE